MTDPRFDSLAALAQYCWRNVHWRKTADGPRPIREPLKKNHLEAHLAGTYGVGLAPIVPGHDTTKIAVLDFDSHQGDVPFDKMRELARTIYEELQGHGIFAHPFRSSGGKGIHLIMLWPAPQDAYSVRERLRLSLTACGLKSGTKGVRANEVEIFPKQDSVPADGFGNMFVLPWAGQSCQLDAGDFHPITRTLTQPLQWRMSAPVEVRERPLPPVKQTAALSPQLTEVRAALVRIPNDGVEHVDYDTWRNIMFAVHHATGGSDEGLSLAHEFSARSSNYDPDFLNDRVWPYIDSERPNAITERTLFQLARAHEDPADDFDLLPEAETLQPADPGRGVGEHPATTSLSSGSRFRVIPADEFSKRPAPEWIVRGILPRSELVVVFGESGSGKSFWVLDLMCATAQRKPWRDCKVSTTPCRVVYIAAEAAGGFRNRLVAYATHHETQLHALPLGVVENAPNFLKTEDVRALLLEIKKFGAVDVIVVDTFAQVTPGGNENAGEDMGRALANCRALHRATKAVVVLIHHAGKDLSKGARGWSGLRAAADAEIEISRAGEERLATITKQKDGSDGKKYPFRLTVVPIGTDTEGETIDSCVVTHQEASARAVAREPTGENARLVWKAIHDIADLCGEVTVASAIAEALKHKPMIPGQRDVRKYNLLRALESLAADGLIEVNHDRIMFLQ